MEWQTKEMPKVKGDYLVTIFDDNAMENIVINCRWDDIPVSTPCRFYRDNEDITDYVIAWEKFPEPYDKTHNPINRTDPYAWVSQHT